MAWRIGVDVGGTFTDIVALDEATGQRHVHKVSSIPSDVARAFITGIKELMDELGVGPDEVGFISHGTTVATNAILESKYSRMGLIVTRGYREMLEVARQTVPGDFGDITWWIKPDRVVPLELVREVRGRFTFRGDELEPLDENAIREFAGDYKKAGINAIAVSFLHSYRNPAHEQRARDVIKEAYPECYVSISSDVIREYREYERTLSTCLNTGLMPLVSSYISSLESRLKEERLDAHELYVMKSSGGIVRAGEMVTQPIAAVLSGPAAGVITAVNYSGASGDPDVITMDIGGTSTDICLIDAGKPHMLTEGKIDVFNIKTPMIDIHTVGAGGGSIAWLAGNRSLRVGPQSAGADPGPVCYSKGGTEPTVTDAHIALGRISPYLVGGSIQLDVEAARTAIAEKIGGPLGLSLEDAAAGILELANLNIVQGINVVSVKRGRDPRHYGLFAFGGAGGLNACAVSDLLGIRTVIVPPSPGVTAAEGLLFTDVRVDHVITNVQREDELDAEGLGQEYQRVRDLVLADLKKQGFEAAGTSIEAFGDMRYAGQAFEIRVPIPLPGATLDEEALRAAIKTFHALHDDRYGYSYEGHQLVEVVNVGVTGLGLFERPTFGHVEAGVNGGWEAARRSLRQGYFKAAGGYVELPVYERNLGPAGVPIDGPAIIEQYDATLVVEPGWSAQIDTLGQIRVIRA